VVKPAGDFEAMPMWLNGAPAARLGEEALLGR
jgi:hypothetical protein